MKQKYWGKVVGSVLGFTYGGPFGGVLGFFAGHAYDNRQDAADSAWHKAAKASFVGAAQQVAYTAGISILSAKLAKVDGRVVRPEIDAFKKVFEIKPVQEAAVGKLFDNARKNADDFQPHAFKMAQIFNNNPAVLEQILFGLMTIAAADAPINAAEARFLKEVAYTFNCGPEQFKRIVARAAVTMPDGDHIREHERSNANEPFAVLGISEKANNDDVKAAYRNLIRKHHPDKMAAEGLSPDKIATANEKMKRINIAYDTICKVRGIK